jgi:hypothetical protein
MYTATGDTRFLYAAEHAATCLETAVSDLNFSQEFLAERFGEYSSSADGSLFWGTSLLSLSSYYRATGKPMPTYLRAIADHLLELNFSNPVNISQKEIRRVRGLVNYYMLTGESKYLNEAMTLMAALDTDPAYLHEYVTPQYARALCELYAARENPKLLANMRKYWQQVVVNAAMLTNETPAYAILIWYQTAVAADSCYSATGEPEFKRLLLRALAHEIAAIDLEYGGIIEMGRRKTLSLNAEITRLLIKYHDNLLLNTANVLDNALNFLNKSYFSETFFSDEYLNCQGAVIGCNMEFRKIDVAVDIMYLPEQIRSDPRIFAISTKADEYLKAKIRAWTSEEFTNKPIDLWCAMIVLYPEHTAHMQKQVVANLQNGVWFNFTDYPYGEWRKITDESWCVRALVLAAPEQVYTAFNKKLEETVQLLQTITVPRGKFHAVSHVLLTARYLQDHGYDLVQYRQWRDWLVKQQLQLLSEPDLMSNPMFIGEAVYAMAGADCQLGMFVQKLKLLQDVDGGWWFSGQAHGRSVVTLRVIHALSEWQKLC